LRLEGPALAVLDAEGLIEGRHLKGRNNSRRSATTVAAHRGRLDPDRTVERVEQSGVVAVLEASMAPLESARQERIRRPTRLLAQNHIDVDLARRIPSHADGPG
jgi:hypothetical protein